jgi:hypothetical protein
VDETGSVLFSVDLVYITESLVSITTKLIDFVKKIGWRIGSELNNKGHMILL